MDDSDSRIKQLRRQAYDNQPDLLTFDLRLPTYTKGPTHVANQGDHNGGGDVAFGNELVGRRRREHAGLIGTGASAAPMIGYPKIFNIESDPREEHNIGAMYEWVIGPALKTVEEYKASLVKTPNPPAANITRF